MNSTRRKKIGNIMNRTINSRTLLALAAWLVICAPVVAQTSSRLSSRFLARGEQALLEIAVTGSRPDAFPEIPSVDGVEIRPAGRGVQTRLMPGRRLEHVFEYLVSSYDTGSHVLPSFAVNVGGTVTRSEPLEFSVFNPDELRWSDAVAGNTRFRYASAFRALNTRPFEGETTPVEIKIYVPRDLFVEDWGIPDFQRDGVTAWRFQPSAMRGQVNLLGLPHVSVAYPSTLTPTRQGAVAIGPATVRLITTEVMMEGILRRVSREVNLTIPALELESRPLPEGAPEGFENAVGDFKLTVDTALKDVQEGDPIPVEMVVTGSGNLDTLRPPAPVDSAGWKLYDASPEARGDERRELSGTVVFRQFMRPLEMKSALPAFRLVFFDPKAREYRTAMTEPIPLNMTPATASPAAGIAPPQSAAVPVERMTDILGVLDIARATRAPGAGLPAWLPHALAALLALGLIGKALWMRAGHHFQRDPVRAGRLADLREIEQLAKNADDWGFLMAAGRFIERWLGTNPPPEVAEVIAERDKRCFRGGQSPAGSLDPQRRQSIVRTLRGAATLWLAVVLLGSTAGSARAAADPAAEARAAYDAARYDEAAALWLKAGDFESLTADTLYNIGNAFYRAGSTGHAALYYRRALARDPGHQEARQNLRFIERKHGAITVQRPEYQYVLARIPLAAWQGMLWAGAWLCLLGLLVFPATRPGARLRVAAVVALALAPLLAAVGALGWRHFPNDAQFAPLARQAVVIGDNVVLRTDAARTSPEVIDAPPGSLCEVVKKSGDWAYVAFATKTRGWVPVAAIEKIIPETAPAPPKIRKAKADGKSA
jgi:tetratricopeptide (TPR) repeat protein